MHPKNSFEAWLKDGATRPVSLDYSSARYADPLGVRLKTSFLDWVSVKTDRRTRLHAIRGMQFVERPHRMAPGHSHPVAAAVRADASQFLSGVAAKLGKRRFDVSISSRELRVSTAGTRQFRVAKDLLSDAVHGSLHPEDFVTMVDTDYYMSEQQLSRYAGHDIGIYALKPNGLSGGSEDSTWRFVSPTEVVEEVAGGAIYRHQVWDWGRDMLVLSRGGNTYLYDPIVFDIAPGRVVVVLLLARTLRVPLALSSWLLPDLKASLPGRMEVTKQGDFLVGVFGPVAHKQVHVISGSTVGETHVSLGLNTFVALAVAAKIPNTDRKVEGYELMPASVERLTKAAGEQVSTSGCYVLSRYFTTAYRAHSFANYQSREGLVLEDGVTCVRVAAVPLAGAGCAPTSSHNNEARAVKARVTDVSNQVEFSDELKGYGREFASQVVRKPWKGVPWSTGELSAQQDKPTQRARRLQEEQHVADKSKTLRTTSFQKRETYAKPGDPRLINQVPTDHTNRLCAFAGAIKPMLKSANGRWYAVGKTPTQVALGLRGLQRAAGELVGGDYSRMDGRTSVSYRRYVLEPVYKRFFAREYHKELTSLLRKEESAVTRTRKFGVRADMGGANLSGSGITTDLNTLDAAFNEFAARRRRGESVTKAFKNLGFYFGDDSVVAKGIFAEVVSVAAECGMKLEPEPTPEDAGPGYVVFLSRVYPDISTSLASHPVMVRSLRKLCTVAAGADAPVAEVMRKLCLKVEAVLITDQHVPVLSAYARALKKVYKLDGVKGTKGWEQAAKADAEHQEKVSRGPYPFQTGDVELLRPSVAAGLGITVEESLALEQRLRAATNEEDLAALTVATESVVAPEWAAWVPV